jgi:hypothetical protein
LGIVAVMALASSRTSPWRRCYFCRRNAGVIAALASLRTLPWRRLGIVAVAALASSRTSPWRHCHRCCRGAGVVVVLASSRPSPWRRLGIVAVAALASLLMLPCAVVIIAVAALASSRRWHHCGRCPGAAWASLLSRRWRHCGRCPGAVAVIAVVALASSRRWHHCGRLPGAAWASTGVISLLALVVRLSPWVLSIELALDFVPVTPHAIVGLGSRPDGLAPPPFMGVDARLLVLGLFESSQSGRRPSGPVPLCCPTLPSRSP